MSNNQPPKKPPAKKTPPKDTAKKPPAPRKDLPPKATPPKDDNIEVFEDDQIVTLLDDNDNPVDFFEVACVEYEDNFYALLQPVEPMEGIADDEVVIFRLDPNPDDEDEDLFVPVDDQKLLEKVFEEFLRKVADDEKA